MSFFSNLSSLFKTQSPAAPKKTQVGVSPDQKQAAPISGSQVAVGAAPTPSAAQFLHSKSVQPKKPIELGKQLDKSPKQALGQPVTLTPQMIQELDAQVREARAKAREIIVEAKDEALVIRTDAERKARQAEQQLTEQQRSLQQKLDRLDESFRYIAIST